MLTAGFGQIPELDVRSDCKLGLVYPSVIDMAGAYNTVFHSDFATQRLKLLHAMEILINERDGTKLSIEITDNAIEFHDGEIEWLGDRRAVPKIIDNKNILTYITDGRSYIIPVCDTDPSQEDIELLLNA